MALETGPSTTELREFDLPDVREDAALLKMEVAGVCGTDVSQYADPPWCAPHHGPTERRLPAKVGRLFSQHKDSGKATSSSSSITCRAATVSGITQANIAIGGDRVVLRPDRDPLQLYRDRYRPALVGRVQSACTPFNAVLHRVPDGLTRRPGYRRRCRMDPVDAHE